MPAIQPRSSLPKPRLIEILKGRLTLILKHLFPSITNEQRNKMIDGLRGLSILMVVFSHFGLHLTLLQNRMIVSVNRTIADISNGMGFYGVVVFFVVSGFLITGISLKRYKELPLINFSNFWWMRFSRLMPMLLLCIFGMVAFHLFRLSNFVFTDTTSLTRTVFSILAFRFDQVAGSDPALGAWNPMWSLSVEEMFYFAFPFACLCINGPGAVTWLMTTVIATSVYFRISGYAGSLTTLACMDFLAIGCVVAIARPERLRGVLSDVVRKSVGLILCLAGLCVITLCVVIWHPFLAPVWPPFICALGAASIVVSSQLIGLHKVIRWVLMPVSILGVASYELYLIHMPLKIYFESVAQLHVWPCLLIIFAAAVAVHEYFSNPINKTLRKFVRMQGTSGKLPEPAELEAQNHQRYARRCFFLAIAPLCAVLALCMFADQLRIPVFKIHFDSIKSLPVGTAEPLAGVGIPGIADIVFLQHDDNGRVQIGINHWGSSDIPLSAALNSSDLIGKEVQVKFSHHGVVVKMDDRVLVQTLVAPSCQVGRIQLAVNNIGFPAIIPEAASTFRMIK
jgi:peptidoglycan/LPS O-acetylase OafA/YrhL